MLAFMRQALKGWAGKLLIGLFILPFLFIGAESLFTVISSDGPLEINGESISEQELARAIEITKQNYAQRLGPDFDLNNLPDGLIKEASVNQLIEQKLSEQYAEENNLDISFEDISKIIRELPYFLDDSGQFSQEVFETVAAQQGMSTKAMLELIKSDVSLNQPRQAIALSAFSLEKEVLLNKLIENQKRSFSYLSLKLEDYLKDIQPSDEEVSSYYQENIAQFMTDESVKVEYLEFKLSDFSDQVTVSEDDQRAQFEVEKAQREESLKRRASHILIALDELSEDEALDKIEEIQTKLESGSNFEALAKEFSQDPGSAAQGGDLGFTGKGDFDPDFEEALFELELGQVSEPVLTEFGYHLIKLNDIESAEEFIFDKEKSRIKADLSTLALEDIYQEKIAIAEESLFEDTDLDGAATSTGLEIKVSQVFTKRSGSGIAGNAEVRKLAFSDEVLNQGLNSSIVELAAGHAVALRLLEHQKPEEQPLSEVKEGIVTILKNKGANDKMTQQKDDILVALESEEGASGLLKSLGLKWVEEDDASRSQAGIPAEILREVFKMPRPSESKRSISDTRFTGRDIAIIELKEVIDATEIESKQLNQAQNLAEQQAGGLAWQMHLNQLKRDAEIVHRKSEE